MRFVAAAIIACSSVCVADVVEGQTAAKIDRDIQAAHLGTWWGAVGVQVEGRTILAKGYGLANKGLAPITADSLFDIGSVTKQFTAAAILRLEMDGKLTTDDRVAMWVDDVPRENQGITIYHLLTHTSGISQKDVAFGGEDSGPSAARANMSARARHAPGEEWEYSNSGYFTLAAVIERASGQTYEAYLKEHIFEPAGMKSTAIMGDPSMFEAERLTDRMGPKGKAVGNAAKWPYPVKWGYIGAGGVVSSVNDMLAWDRALRTDSVLNGAAKAKYFKAFKHNYACGWECEDSAAGALVTHSGGVQGYATWFTRYLEKDAAIVVLTGFERNPREVEQLIRADLFPDSGPALGVLMRPGQFELNEWKGCTIKEGLGINVRREGGAAVIEVMAGGKPKPAATLTLSVHQMKALKGRLSTAISGKGEGEKIEPPACDLYTRPYEAKDGEISLSGDDISCTIMPSVSEGSGAGGHVDARITLVVVDEANSFWPLMLRMDMAMAKSLLEKLGE